MTDHCQRALLHGSGLLSGLSVYRARPNTSRRDLLEACARLLHEFEAEAPDRCFALVALSPRLAGERVSPVLPRTGPGGVFPSTQGDVFLQVAGLEREPFLRPFRRTEAVLRGLVSLDEELYGGRIADGREPFGFPDLPALPTTEQIREQAVLPSGPLAGCSWLLYLRFRQDLERFGLLRPAAQERVMGLTRAGERLPDAPPDSHLAVTSGQTFIRRGFPYRAHGEEGLAFLAAARDAGYLGESLDALLGNGSRPPDAVLRYAAAVGGGLYLVPPSSGWVADRVADTLWSGSGWQQPTDDGDGADRRGGYGGLRGVES